jgi:hypothetical protein
MNGRPRTPPFKQETGYEDGDRELTIANCAQVEIENQIARIPAKTIDGLLVKALAAISYEGLPLEDRPDLKGEDDIIAEEIMYQLAWDILEIGRDARGA